jgi:hypothetical protein
MIGEEGAQKRGMKWREEWVKRREKILGESQ